MKRRHRRRRARWIIPLALCLLTVGCQLGAYTFDGPWHAALDGATRLEVRARGDEVLLVVEDAEAIADLIARVEVEPDNALTCRCAGQFALAFEVGGSEPVVVTLHHMQHLRLDGWPADGILTPGGLAAMTDWFAAHGFERFELMRLRTEHDSVEPTRAWHRILRHWPESGRDIVAAVDSATLSDEAGVLSFAQTLADEMGPVEMTAAAMRALGESHPHLWARQTLEAPAWAAFAVVDGPTFEAALEAVADEPVALMGAARVGFGSDLLDRLPDETRDRWMVTLAEAVHQLGTRRDQRALANTLRHSGGPRARAFVERWGGR